MSIIPRFGREPTFRHHGCCSAVYVDDHVNRYCELGDVEHRVHEAGKMAWTDDNANCFGDSRMSPPPAEPARPDPLVVVNTDENRLDLHHGSCALSAQMWLREPSDVAVFSLVTTQLPRPAVTAKLSVRGADEELVAGPGLRPNELFAQIVLRQIRGMVRPVLMVRGNGHITGRVVGIRRLP